MYAPAGVKTSKDFPIPDNMKAWVLGDPGELKLIDKAVPVPKKAEVLVRIDAVAICATDLEIIHHGSAGDAFRAACRFNKNFTPGHEYMGTVVGARPQRRRVQDRRAGHASRSMPAAANASAAARACTRRAINYGLNYGEVDKGHRANGFTTDGGFCGVRRSITSTRWRAIPDDHDRRRGDARRDRRHRRCTA
jgi:L-iditol 2-dehydrogenase